ncbi:MAG: DUF6746 family protein [Aquisalimonadaceae bacterium]
MIRYSLPFLLVMGLSCAASTLADDRIDHFKGEPAETLEQAVASFSEYNARLATVLDSGDLTARDLGKIHELTYTLENALGKINEDLTALADTLEALHIASETAEIDDAKRHAANYLETARKVVP